MGQTKSEVKGKKPAGRRAGSKDPKPADTTVEAPAAITTEAELVGAINKAIKGSVAALQSGELSGTRVGELLKLIQIQKELGTEQPKQINVQWVETWESTSLNEE